jgi:hypothetical protein
MPDKKTILPPIHKDFRENRQFKTAVQLVAHPFPVCALTSPEAQR